MRVHVAKLGAVLWIVTLLGLSACNQRAQSPESKSGKPAPVAGAESIYPHTSVFKISAEHGYEFKSDPQVCKTCHGVNLDGGTASVSCNTCHKVYPHNDEFKTTKAHGLNFINQPWACVQCHQVRSEADLTQPSRGRSGSFDSENFCTGCHQVYPHPSNFANTPLHGITYQKDPAACKACHGSNLDGADTKISCNLCHSIYPHTDDFKYSTLHGVTYLSNKAICGKCHEVQGKPDNEKACQKCHDFPHIPVWNKPTHHGEAFKKSYDGDDNDAATKSTCLLCHGEDSDLAKNHPESFVSCGTCHIILPHKGESGTTDFISDHPIEAQKYRSQCIACHKINQTPPGEEKCALCHETGKNPDVRWTDVPKPPAIVPTPTPEPPKP